MLKDPQFCSYLVTMSPVQVTTLIVAISFLFDEDWSKWWTVEGLSGTEEVLPHCAVFALMDLCKGPMLGLTLAVL